jgi:hypothetical protein
MKGGFIDADRAIVLDDEPAAIRKRGKGAFDEAAAPVSAQCAAVFCLRLAPVRCNPFNPSRGQLLSQWITIGAAAGNHTPRFWLGPSPRGRRVTWIEPSINAASRTL